jgi:putative membrane protein
LPLGEDVGGSREYSYLKARSIRSFEHPFAHPRGLRYFAESARHIKESRMKRVSGLMVMAALPMLVMGAESNSDESFFASAAEGGLSEVSAGKLAEDKGSSPAIKDFGGMMVKDHSKADQKLWSLAADKNIKLPATPSVEQAAAGEKLKLLSGKSFDKAYIKNQIDAHRDTVALFKKEIASGKDPQAKQFASATLPTVQAHLAKIMQIATAAGVSAD